MPEAVARVGELEICYETFGDPGEEPMLLIMGLGMQMVAWPDDFCAELVKRGFYVIRHDNRDIGRSTYIDSARGPTLRQLLTRDKRAASYTLTDMAGDSVGVLDALGIEKAHIVGASMGGMIAQTLAIHYPERVLSLVSIMSNTGSRWTGQPSLSLYAALLTPAPRDREGFVEHGVKLFQRIGGSAFKSEPDADLREMAERSYDRGHNPRGSAHQLAAIIAERDRSAALHELRMPVTVIHGTEDPLVRPSGGRATARAIPGARLVTVKTMGHGLPRSVWPQIIDAIAANAARAATPAPESAR